MAKNRDAVKTALAATIAKQPNPNPLATTTAPLATMANPVVEAMPAETAPPRLMQANTIRPVSVGLRRSELAELDQIARSVGVRRNAVMAWAIRQFLADQRAGRVKLADHLEARTTPVVNSKTGKP